MCHATGGLNRGCEGTGDTDECHVYSEALWFLCFHDKFTVVG